MTPPYRLRILWLEGCVGLTLAAVLHELPTVTTSTGFNVRILPPKRRRFTVPHNEGPYIAHLCLSPARAAESLRLDAFSLLYRQSRQ